MVRKIFCLLAVLAIAGTASAELLAYYDFTDASGLPTSENEGTAGAAADGTLMNGASIVDIYSTNPFCPVQHVLNLDYGDGSVHQYMDIGGGTSTGWANWNGEAGNKQPMTIAAWIYKTPGTWGNWRTIMSHGYEQSWNLSTGTQPNPDENMIAFSAHRGLASWSPIIGTTSVQTPGYWHHVVGTVIDASRAELYIDGVFQGSKSCWIGVNYSESDVWIGYDPLRTDYDYSWNGMIDKIAIYNHALSATEIYDIFWYTYYDYYCIPEPTTIALLGLGGLALLRRKR